MARCVALCSFEGSRERSRHVSGGYGEGETPLPIPNRAVKPLSADGTWLARAWESRSPPVFSTTPFVTSGVVVCEGCGLASGTGAHVTGLRLRRGLAVTGWLLRFACP